MDVLDLSEIEPTFGQVHDLRGQASVEAGEPSSSSRGHVWLGQALVIPAFVFVIVSIVMMIVALPFDLIVGLFTGRRGLVLGAVQWLLSIITAPISVPRRKRVKAARTCPMCHQVGTVDNITDITWNGN